jgi:hypothetical protein
VEPSIVVALLAAAAAFASGLFTFFASRRTSDDSRTIGLINAGQTALESALERSTEEVTDLRSQVGSMRSELGEVRTELDRALSLHAECERMRVMDSDELRRLRQIVEGRQ